MIERRRKWIEDCLRKKFKNDIDVCWRETLYGNQIIELVILVYDMHINVEIDRMLFIDNDTQANVDFILYYVKRHIWEDYICNERCVK